MIVLNILGYFGRNKQNSYAALMYLSQYFAHTIQNKIHGLMRKYFEIIMSAACVYQSLSKGEKDHFNGVGKKSVQSLYLPFIASYTLIRNFPFKAA